MAAEARGYTRPGVRLFKKDSAALIILSGLLLLSGACTPKPEPAPGSGAPSKKTIHLAIWSNYLAPETLAEFQARTGHQVRVSHFSSNEELLAKLQAGATGYDVIVPSDYMVFAMGKLGLLRKLDGARIPNAGKLDPRYLKRSFDPKNEYSVPYDVGTTGIAINRTLFKGRLQGWKDLYSSAELSGKFSLLDDARETLGTALKAQGFSLNTRDPEQLRKAKALLVRNRSRIKSFNSETLAALTQGEVAVAHAYVSDALQARKATGGKIEYVLPEEGGTFYIDNLSIPASAGNPDEAHALIDFLLEPKVGAATTLSVFVAPASQGALALLPPGFREENRALFPGEAQLSKFELLEDLGDDAQLWDRLWTEIKAER